MTCPDCSAEIFDLSLELENIKSVFYQWRIKHNIPQPEELILCRQRLKFGLRQMANCLECSLDELSFYEKGILIPQDGHLNKYKELLNKVDL